METPGWTKKANEIIAKLCQESYNKANIKPDGTKRKHHVPYSVPPLAAQLTKCLGNNDEAGAKALFFDLMDFPERSRGL